LAVPESEVVRFGFFLTNEGERPMIIYDFDKTPTTLLNQGYLRLGVYAMQTVGPAARTMGALYELADRRTRGMRVSIARIAALCGLPRRTVQRHLHVLEHQFRGIESWQTRGASRYRIGQVAWTARSQFRAMPKWWTILPECLQDWSTTATYAWLLSRACLVERLEEKGGSLEDRMQTTRQEIAQITGLSRRSVSAALELLTSCSLICISESSAHDPVFEFQMGPFGLQRLNPQRHTVVTPSSHDAQSDAPRLEKVAPVP
jgi:DNA-binding transcriptional ArsR family regulator